jgi:RNA polymerase sigma-70 factor (ECF subfamily)
MTTPEEPSENVTQLLCAWSDGDQAALDQLIPLVYRELHRLAHHYVRNEGPAPAFQTTELVNEAYLRLIKQNRVRWQNRAHFFGIASQLMRRILVDRARHRNRVKRGAGAPMVSLDGIPTESSAIVNILELDQALNRLAQLDQRKAQVVELRFFGGLEVDEAAAFLNVSAVTVVRDWRMAKAWLHKELSPNDI